jgi:hypothetical protein
MASQNISTAFVKQYGTTIDMLLELKGGQFDGKCLEETIVGEEKYYDQLGSVYANEVIDRYGDSPENDISHARRRVIATPYDVGIMFDTFDKVQMLVNPESEYVQRQVSALRRKKAIEFFKGALGTASTGKGGAGSSSLAAANAINSGGTGMSLAKLVAAKKTLELGNVDLLDPMNRPYFVWTPTQAHELLSNTTVSSSDYNSIKTLVSGQINTFYGFEFITSNQVPYTTESAAQTANLVWDATDAPVDADNDIRACFAYVKSAVRFVTNPEIKVDVSLRKDKRNNWYSYACARFGAVRMEEDKVVVVGCDEDLTD